jgi:hypothetical protein
VKTNYDPAIKELQEKIKLEMAGIRDSNQEHYVAGLSDALGIIMKHLKNELIVGNTYYIVMPKDDVTNEVVKMRLYKITLKSKLYYSFTTKLTGKYTTNDLVLSNTNSIKMRVFESEKEAENMKHVMLWRRENRELGRR